jgi:AraC-like DNA-binding protein
MEMIYKHSIDNGVFVLNDLTIKNPESMEKHNDLFKMFWVRQGSGDFIIDGYSVTLKEDQLLFLTPAHTIEAWPSSPDVAGFGWNREFYCIRDNDLEVGCDGLLFYGSSKLTVIDLEQKDCIRFETLYDFIAEELKEKDGIQEEMLRVLLKRWLLLSARIFKKTFPGKTYEQDEVDICRKFNIEVEKNFRELHKVSDYAGILYKSPKTLSNLFTKYGNKSPRQLINDRIVLEAKRLAKYSAKAVNEIAYELGYEDPGHFSRLFKRNVGVSVSQFRAAIDS